MSDETNTTRKQCGKQLLCVCGGGAWGHQGNRVSQKAACLVPSCCEWDALPSFPGSRSLCVWIGARTRRPDSGERTERIPSRASVTCTALWGRKRCLSSLFPGVQHALASKRRRRKRVLRDGPRVRPVADGFPAVGLDAPVVRGHTLVRSTSQEVCIPSHDHEFTMPALSH